MMPLIVLVVWIMSPFIADLLGWNYKPMHVGKRYNDLMLMRKYGTQQEHIDIVSDLYGDVHSPRY